MLVLSRRPHESFRIGHDVVITVLEVSGDKVRIGIDAPADVQVHRQEIYVEVQRANEAASSSPTDAASLARAIRGAATSSADTPEGPAVDAAPDAAPDEDPATS